MNQVGGGGGHTYKKNSIKKIPNIMFSKVYTLYETITII
jgi:hypothetical protein